MVERGKPAALVSAQKRYTDSALALIESSYNDLFIYKEEINLGWDAIWIYKHDHILEVIKSLPVTPKTTFDHWVLGKLFGYDEAAIVEFLEHKEKLEITLSG